MAGSSPSKFDAKSVLKDANLDKAGGQVRELLPPIQRVGVQLAGGVGCVIAVVTLIIVIPWACGGPATPTIATGLGRSDSPEQVEAAKKVIENYKLLMETRADQATKVFSTIVAGALLPVFTSILGYIFGSRSSSQAPRDGTP